MLWNIDGGQEMAEMVGQWKIFLITTIQVNLVLIPSEASMRKHKFTC